MSHESAADAFVALSGGLKLRTSSIVLRLVARTAAEAAAAFFFFFFFAAAERPPEGLVVAIDDC